MADIRKIIGNELYWMIRDIVTVKAHLMKFRP